MGDDPVALRWPEWVMAVARFTFVGQTGRSLWTALVSQCLVDREAGRWQPLHHWKEMAVHDIQFSTAKT